MKIPRLVVHGGAWNIPESEWKAHQNGVKKAVELTLPKLLNGMCAIDAVECAVNVLEADPTFDAGKGAFLNANGEIELDAIIADGNTVDFGAVAAIQNFLHPVSIAKAVLQKSQHCLLVANGAAAFANQNGFTSVSPKFLLTNRELQFYKEIQNNPNFHSKSPFENPKGTVGAVAVDKNGNIAAATSTGGTPRKSPGRVGDTPIFGAGVYADNTTGAASATGWGEAIMRSLLCKTICDDFAGKLPSKAVRDGILYLKNKFDGYGGIISITAKHQIVIFHNTEKMAYAYANKNGEIISGMEINDQPILD